MNCPLCLKENFEIENLNKNINQAKGVLEKAKFAKILLGKANSLIERHEDKSLPCISILNLRKRTAELIIKSQKLA